VQGSSRPPAQGATRVSALDPRAKVEITVTLRGPKLPPAARLIGNSLSLGEFKGRYGASQRDIDKVSQVLRTYGLKIESISRETRSMRVSGMVAQMEDAFQPQLAVYRSAEQGEFRDRQNVYNVPASLRNIITGLIGAKGCIAKARADRSRPRAARSGNARTAL
jgi:kumamolisin